MLCLHNRDVSRLSVCSINFKISEITITTCLPRYVPHSSDPTCIDPICLQSFYLYHSCCMCTYCLYFIFCTCIHANVQCPSDIWFNKYAWNSWSQVTIQDEGWKNSATFLFLEIVIGILNDVHHKLSKLFSEQLSQRLVAITPWLVLNIKSLIQNESNEFKINQLKLSEKLWGRAARCLLYSFFSSFWPIILFA